MTFLPKTGLSEIAGEGMRIVVLFPLGEAALDSEAVNSFVEQAGGPEITLEIRKLAAAEFAAAGEGPLPENASLYDISVYSGGTLIHDYSGKLTVTAPYAGRLPAGAWYMGDGDEQLEKLPSVYSAARKTVSFSPPHLSRYVVGHDSSPWPFTDVKEGEDWFFGDVEYAYFSGLMNGTGGSLFEPGISVTRGMLVTLLGRYRGADTSSYPQSAFGDVDAGKYYSPYIAWAAENGIVEGLGGGRFAPDDPVTRQDFVTILRRYALFEGKISGDAPSSPSPAFSDMADVSDYAKEAVAWASAAGIANGRPGNIFDPEAGATRAEAAAMVRRFIESGAG